MVDEMFLRVTLGKSYGFGRKPDELDYSRAAEIIKRQIDAELGWPVDITIENGKEIKEDKEAQEKIADFVEDMVILSEPVGDMWVDEDAPTEFHKLAVKLGYRKLPKGELIKLVMKAYKEGHRDGENHCEADYSFFEKLVEE